jgi:succinate dehydrogenase / fumarate reductase flavoprotein subunit
MKDIAKVYETDVLIVGGGGAGCYAALRARDFAENVLIASKGYVGPGSVSATLGGGINICFPEDDKKLWMEELVERGEYLNDQEWVKIQLEEVYPLAMQLDQWGTSYGLKIFEKDARGKFSRRKARGNINTITTVINGFPLMETLRRKVLERKIPLVERVMVTDLLMKNGRPVGALGFDYRQGEFILFKAKAIVLAGGGCSFKISLCSPAAACTGEAQLMAYEAGAILRNIDQAMSQSNPKAIEMHGMTLFAGVGGKFLNGLGEEFMLRYDPKVGSRARLTKLVIGMAKEVEAGRGPIYMDMTGTSAADQEMLRSVLPEPMRAFASANIDPFKEQIPWTPVIFGTQTHGGGVHIDTRCATNVPGLYVAGDTSCTPEHGTWSITGLNIAFAVLSGYRAGEFASEYAKHVAGDGNEADTKEQVRQSIARITKPIKRVQGVSPDDLVQRIWQIITPYEVCYLRNEERLAGALKKLEALRDEMLPQVWARDPHELAKASEVRSMVAIAEIIVRSVLFRKESRGFVFREDYPMTDNLNWLKWIMVQKEGEHMKVWAEEFPTPYIDPPREIYPPR